MIKKYFTTIILLQIGFTVAFEKLGRQKRFVIVGPKNFFRHQLIWGVGVPIEADISLITGWVLKSQFLRRFVTYEDYRPAYFIYDRNLKDKRSTDNREIEDIYQNETFYRNYMADQQYDGLKLNSSISSYDKTIDTPSNPWYNRIYFDDNKSIEDNIRFVIYKMIESLADSKGFNGKSCMLKSICEAGETKFTHHSGIVGELLHVFLTYTLYYSI